MDTDAIRSRLAEEEALLTLLGRLLYGMPDRDLFARVVEERLFESIPFVDGARARQPQDLLLAWMDACATPFSDSDFEAVRVDYTRLFVGAQKVAAPLWESVHFSRERMVFQERTLQVRAAYRAYNLEVEGFQHEPDDHLASELLFAAHLVRIAKESLDAGNEEGFERAMSDQHDFLEEHPNSWVEGWRDLILEKSNSNLYRGLSMLIAQACKESALLAKELKRANDACPGCEARCPASSCNA